jgi:hypothetical protein
LQRNRSVSSSASARATTGAPRPHTRFGDVSTVECSAEAHVSGALRQSRTHVPVLSTLCKH